MERVLLEKIKDYIEKEIKISGRIDIVRDHKKVIFIVLSDRSAKVQCVVKKDNPNFDKFTSLKEQDIISLTGSVKNRLPDNIKEEKNGDYEFLISDVSILSSSKELPFEVNTELNIDTKLDYRPLTLRSEKDKAFFKLQNVLINSFRKTLMKNGFFEFRNPCIVGDDAEGGSAVFSIDYFGNKAGLNTSPQLYKQILVGVYERVFTISQVFRAEKHSTTRHLSEYTSMDFEMGFIENEEDVMDMLEACMRDMVEEVEKEKDNFNVLDMEKVLLPKEKFPSITLSKTHELLEKEYGIVPEDLLDLTPEQERFICEYAKKEFNSDFIFITKFPREKRPMYAYVNKDDENLTDTFDLLFRGVEITSGGQRAHIYEDLIKNIEHKLGKEKIDDFSFYLQAFKYGMPPHGGIGMGLERITQKFAGVKNVREVTFFPRDRNRIDNRLKEE